MRAPLLVSRRLIAYPNLIAPHLAPTPSLRRLPNQPVARSDTLWLGVQQTDLVVMSIVKRLASHLRLTINDLLGFAPGFSISGSDVPEAPVEMGRDETALDFTPRPAAGPGQEPGDLFCGGLWGFAGDVHERFVELPGTERAFRRINPNLDGAPPGMMARPPLPPVVQAPLFDEPSWGVQLLSLIHI